MVNLPFDVVKSNLITLGKFKVGDKPVINYQTSEISKENRWLFVRWRRGYEKAFDPVVIDRTLQAAKIIVEKQPTISRIRHRTQAEEIQSLFRQSLQGIMHIWKTYFDNRSPFAEKLANTVIVYTPKLMNLKNSFYKSTIEGIKSMWEAYAKRKEYGIADRLAATYNAYGPAEKLNIVNFNKKTSGKNTVLKSTLARFVATKSKQADSVKRHRQTLNKKGYQQWRPVVKKEKTFSERLLETKQRLKRVFDIQGGDQQVKKFEENLQQKKYLQRTCSESQVYFDQKVLLRAMIRDRVDKPECSPAIENVEADMEFEWEEVVNDPYTDFKNEMNLMQPKTFFLPAEANGLKDLPLMNEISEVFPKTMVEEFHNELRIKIAARRMHYSDHEGSSDDE